MLFGIFNYYYKPITLKSTLSRYHYIFKFSCLKTLAARKKTSITEITKQYGRKLTIKWIDKYKNKKDEIITRELITNFPEYLETMETTRKRFNKKTKQEETIEDFLNIKINLRTTYKLYKYCTICGTTGGKSNPIESHHIKAIKKTGTKLTPFSEIMKNINRKQIICCKQCHIKIHQGKYDGMKLSEFYDPILAEM
jgi:hypothetical protein